LTNFLYLLQFKLSLDLTTFRVLKEKGVFTRFHVNMSMVM